MHRPSAGCGDRASVLVAGRLYIEIAVDQHQHRRDAAAWWHHAGDGGHLAVAAARLGARVSLFAQAGLTSHDDEMLGTLAGEGIRIEEVVRRATTTVNAHVHAESHGTHQPIALSSPAHCTLVPDDVDAVEHLMMNHQWLLVDAALPVAFLDAMTERACRYGLRTVLCAKRPLKERIPRRAWKNIDYLVAGSSMVEALARQFNDARITPTDPGALCREVPSLRGILVVRGAHEIYVHGDGENSVMPVGARVVLEVRGVCAMAAGAFTVALAEGADVLDAARFAHAAVRFYITHEGTRAAMPFRKEME